MQNQSESEKQTEKLKKPEEDQIDRSECMGADSEDAGMADRCIGCPMRQMCLSRKKQVDPDEAKIQKNMSSIKHKILILSGKGGVGKSTFASQLAFILSNMDEEDNDEDDDDEGITQVGLLDVDLCGPSIPTIFQLKEKTIRETSVGWSPVYYKENLGIISIDFLLQNENQAVIMRGAQKNGMIARFLKDSFWGEDGLDYLIIDTPPGTSDEHITTCKYLKKCDLDGAVIITTPQEVSCIDVRREVNFCKKMKIPILGIVENMSGFICPKCKTKTDIFVPSSGGGEGISKEYGLDFLGKIPLDPQLMKSTENGDSMMKKFPKSETTKSIQKICEKIVEKCKKKE